MLMGYSYNEAGLSLLKSQIISKSFSLSLYLFSQQLFTSDEAGSAK